VTRRRILTHNNSDYAEPRKDVPFRSLHDGRPHGQILQKPSQMGRGYAIASHFGE